jgi:hypothetical protein
VFNPARRAKHGKGLRLLDHLDPITGADAPIARRALHRVGQTEFLRRAATCHLYGQILCLAPIAPDRAMTSGNVSRLLVKTSRPGRATSPPRITLLVTD